MQDARPRFVDLNGHSFHYLEWGRAGAPLLLFLHGFPEYGGAWSEVGHHRVISLRGKPVGRSKRRRAACGFLSLHRARPAWLRPELGSA